MAKKLSPQMTAALRLAFQAEVGISRTDQSVARSGIAEAWMISTNTSAALVGRDYLSPLKGIHLETGGWAPRQQITAAGCEAIGRSMDEIVAWAWREAMRDRAEAGRTGEIMLTLPIEAGAVVGWTHEGQSLTGEVRGIFGDALSIWVPSSSTTGYEWTVELGQIERVIELPRDVVVAWAREQALFEHIERGHNAASIVHGMDEVMCDHGALVVSQSPSTFEGAAPVRTYADGCQSYGPYPERAPMRQEPTCTRCGKPGDSSPDLSHNARIEAAAKTFRELISAAINEAVDATQDTNGRVDRARWARHYELVTEIERRLNLAAALMPVEARQILDGKS